MQSFKFFLRWYNNEEVVPALEAMQKMVEFCYNLSIDMLKFGCKLPNAANIRLHCSSKAKVCLLIDSYENLFYQDFVERPSMVSTSQVVVDKAHIRKSTNNCNSIVGTDGSQLYPFSTCQPIPTRLYTRYEILMELQRFKTVRSNLKLSKFWSFRTFNRIVQLRGSTQQ